MARGWFVIQVQTGYENKVNSILLEKKQGSVLRDVLLDIRVPEEEIFVEKNGKKISKKNKLYPGYVLVELDFPEDEMSWKSVYAEIRGIPGVGMFLSSGGAARKPAPLTFEEVRAIFEKTGDISGKGYDANINHIWEEGEKVRIIDGAFKGFDGIVKEIYGDKGVLVVSVEMFGRMTPVELEYHQLIKGN